MEEENDKLKANLEQEKKIFDADRETLERKLEMTTNLLQEKEQTLQQKRAQEEQLHRERETKLQAEIKTFETSIMDMTTEREKSEDSYKTQVKELERRIADLENSHSSSRYDNEMLKKSCKIYTVHSTRLEEENDKLKANLEQEKKIFDADRETLERKLEMTTNLLQEKEQTLQQKRAQEEQLHRERETKLQAEIKTFETSIMDMTTEREKSEDSYKTQVKELERRTSDLEDSLSSSRYDNEMLKESLKACCRTSAKSAEEFYGLHKGFEQERQIQQGEIHSLKTQLERMTNELQDAESTLKKELAEKEASTVQTNEQFLACKEGIRKVAKERQNFLKDEVAYREADRALAREKKKTADLHRKLEELNNKLAENFGKSQIAQKPQASLQEKGESWDPEARQGSSRWMRPTFW
ncbi:hypothetical protein SKAU_G00316130 [Synaphobranchus kaupii]|uniref:Uncharacterized protein n=1 Tax=Synaphobranchus kaupii TaxID=118154 RepID=A0A9Q1ESP9_SYNKA|nr:hypothetical protein SKAU_G00316130 [Synaphobranchus kaupii]